MVPILETRPAEDVIFQLHLKVAHILRRAVRVFQEKSCFDVCGIRIVPAI